MSPSVCCMASSEKGTFFCTSVRLRIIDEEYLFGRSLVLLKEVGWGEMYCLLCSKNFSSIREEVG